MAADDKLCAVTGASGFLASELIAQLLSSGYRVRGTVRSLEPSKIFHLLALPGAKTNLALFAADVLDPEAFSDVFSGVPLVFHTACPFHSVTKAKVCSQRYLCPTGAQP